MEAEIQFWKSQLTGNVSSRDSTLLRNVEWIVQYLTENLSKSLRDLLQSNSRDALDILETVDLQLTDLWKQKESPSSKPFPEDRMRNLFSIFENAVVGVIQNPTKNVNLWTSAYREVEEHVLDCQTLCEKWIELCRVLTFEVWTEFSTNAWNATPVVPETAIKIKMRLNEVMLVRATINDTVSLVGSLEKPNPLDVFQDVDALDISPKNQQKWSSTLQNFDAKMERYEHTVVENLKTKFHNNESISLQILMEFRKCRSIIGRPKVKKALTEERDILLGHLAAVIASYEEEYGQDNSQIFDNHSRVISNIIWMRQLILKIRELDVGLEDALGDLQKFPGLNKRLQTLRENAEGRIQDKFDVWSSDVSKALKDPKGNLSLDISGRLMDIEQPSGRLVVNFSDRLVTLIKEVRYLESIGFQVAEAIKERNDLAKKFYDSGIVLMQVAHFYNTIDQQMINSQKPMLIESAKRFEKVIRSVRGGKGNASVSSVATANDVRWSDMKRVESYVNEVHEATLALTQENRRLRSLHQKIVSIVLQMADTSLVQKLTEWKRLLNEIHKIVASVAVESQRYPAENMTPWRLHIDHQIKKALEIQLQRSLLSLAESLPELQVDMIYRNYTLQLRPSIQEIREKFSMELQNLFEIPSSLKPVSEINEKRDFFRQVVLECHSEVAVAHRNLQFLLMQLQRVVEESRQYVVLGSVDIYALVEARVVDVEDWERELKALKQRARSTEQIPLQLRVENVTLNFGPIRTAIDGLLQDTHDALVNTLRKSIVSEVEAISGFVTQANSVLATQPTTTEELATLSGDFHQLVKESTHMKPRLASIEQKNGLLKATVGKGVDKSENILRSWNNVLNMLEDHKSVMKDQTTILQERIQKDIKLFANDVEKFEARWLQARPSEARLDELSVAQIKQVSETVRSKREDLDGIVARRNEIMTQCVQLDLPVPADHVLQRIKSDLDACDVTWKELLDFSQEVETLSQEDWLTFRNKLYKLEEFLKAWSTRIQSSRPTAFTVRIQKEIETYRSAFPSLKSCRGEAFSEEHWAELFAILLLKSVDIEQLTLGHLLTSGTDLLKQASALKDLAARAQAEVSIREALRELEIWGAAALFHLTSYNDAAGTPIQIVKDWSELLSTVGEKQRLLQSTKDSQHYGKFSDRIAIWEQRLVDLSFLLDNLHQIQRRWVYLEPICSRNTLPNEEGRFKRVDGDLRGVLRDIAKEPRLISWMRPALKSVLPGILDQLQRCQKALNQFLEDKRLAFPRFYFIGDDDLLEILGQSSNPKVLQAHLKKLFAGVHSVHLSGDGRQIVAAKSPEGEELVLRSPVGLSGSVEIWLSALSEELKRTLRIGLRECLAELSTKDLTQSYPSQVLRLAEHIRFTLNVEDAVRSQRLPQVKADVQIRLDKLTEQQHGGAADPVQLTTLQGLVLDTIRRLDLISRLVDAKVTAVDSWLWQKQLRFYSETDSSVTVRMVDAEFKYSFEYQGCLTGLVHTPLTDKCFLTLTQAMHMGLGGNPYGPAGTGKTESVKELGAHLGRQVLVFNCDEGIDSKSMGRIFVGLLKCGAWGCFDEFNRLDELTMSAISMQVLAIQAALKDSNQQLDLLDRKIEINREAGIFITLNPASKGYGGRQKLPDNLKQLFRPVAMTVPDADRIAEVMFLAEGFHHAKTMGRKLVAVYSSARELLSPQQHYDWGLRATKSTIQMAGRFVTVRKTVSASKGHLSEMDEAAVVVQAVRSNVLSKLTADDQGRFLELLRDGFPNVDQRKVENVEFEAALSAAFEELGLMMNPIQIQKAIELRDQLAQRIGVVVVGPAASGKTTIWKLLQTSMAKLKIPLKSHVINPTAMPKTQLLGSVDETTREWTDGVLTKCVREVLAEATETAAWIVCDGDIDPDWIESLNSVLDDNRLLTLPSGERLRFPSNVNLLFETNDLKSASPATVSRMGMIFVSSQDVQLKNVIDAWTLKQGQEAQSALKDFTNNILYNAISRAANFDNQTSRISEVSMCANVLSVLEGLTHRAELTAAVVQSIGGALTARYQDKFAEEILRRAGYDPPDSQKPFNVFYDSETENLKAFRMDSNLQNSALPSGLISFDQLPVFPCVSQNLAVMRLKTWLLHGNHIFLNGSAGWGKGVVLKTALRDANVRCVVTVQCTSLTSSQVLVAKLSQNCLSIPTAKGRIMRPKNADRLVLYLKDIHVIRKDRWGHRQVEAFLRQMISQGGFFDDSSEWVELDGVQLVLTADNNSNGDGRSISERLTSIMQTTYLADPDFEDLLMVTSGYFRLIVAAQCKSHVVWSQIPNINKLSKSLVTIFNKCRERFSREKHAHYNFTVKDLTACILALLRYNLQDQSGALLLTALVYEASRGFCDKLTSALDRAQFEGIVSTVLKSDWPSVNVERDAIFAASALPGSTGIMDGAPLPPLGRPLFKTSVADLKLMVNTSVRQINRDNFALEVYIHDALLDGVLKIDHVLSQPGGSILMLAPSGYGRRTMALIAIKLQQAVLIKPRTVKGYHIRHFQADIKRVLDVAAVKNENVVLLMEDFQVVNPVFLEIVTSILANGEFAGLYTEEETDKINNLVADQMAQEGFDGTTAAFLISRIRKNFHCVVTMENKGTRFSLCNDRIPSLSHLFHIIWADSLTEATLLSIPQGVPAAGSPTEDTAPNIPVAESKSQLADSVTFLHQTSPSSLQSSARFFHFLRTFHQVKSNLSTTVRKNSQRLEAGLDQLTKARSDVMALKRTVTGQHQALTSKQEEAKRAMDDIRESMSGANTQKEEVTLLKADLEIERAKLMEREKTIAKELAEVLPVLENAKAAVNKIKTSDLSEIKSLRAPPAVIHNILEGVLKLFGNKDTSWSGMRAFLTAGAKEEIIHFNADKVSKEHLRLTQALVEKNKSSFEEETAKRASVAAAPLAAWVKACVKYAEVYEKIAPLAAEKRKLESTIDMHAMRVNNADQDIGRLSSRIDLLQARFQKLTEEAAVMKIELSRFTQKLEVAEVLVEKLESEYARWSIQLKESSLLSKHMQTNALLCSGFIMYLAACSEDDRVTFMARWCEKFKVESFDLLSQLTTEAERLKWRAEGLSSDTLSMENAVILFNTTAAPLIIDPTGSVVDWLQKFLKNKNVEVLDQEDSNFQSILELAIRFGKSLIVEISETVDPVLVSLLRHDLMKNGSRIQVEMGDKLVDYHPNFSLYLTTRNCSISLHPQTSSILNIVSFTATRAGLANQLLSLVIECKLPEVERRRRELLQEQEALKIKLTQLEDSLLSELASSQGNLLENNELRESLNRTKASSEIAERNLEEARKVKETLDKDQAVFVVLATKCCNVYFALQSLPKLNPLYRFSLQTFVSIYRKAVENLTKDDQVKDQLQKFCAVAFYQVIHYVYAHVNRSIFKRDRLTCLLQFLKFVRPELIKDSEWNFLLTAEKATALSTARQSSSMTFPSWLDTSIQPGLNLLSSVIPDMATSLQLDDQAVWKSFLVHPHCETVFPPSIKVSPFQQVLLIKTLRPDRLVSALSVFVAKSLKLPDLATDTSLRAVLEESSADVPILIVTSGGADPSLELNELGNDRAGKNTVRQIAMGLKEAETAVQAMHEAAQFGSWLCLNNLHLVPAFLQRIMKEVKTLKAAPSFRLWLTTESADAVPVFLLETALKVVYEAPPGVKQNIQRTVKESSELIKVSVGSTPSVQHTILILFWFHAVIQERRNYLPRGWTKFYEFNTSDLRAAMHLISKYGRSTTGALEEYICGLLEDVVYGGRVDTQVDLQILASFVQSFFKNRDKNNDIFGQSPPGLKSVVEFLDHVQSLPELDQPDILGLPANIDGSHQKTESARIFQDLQRLHRDSLLESGTMTDVWNDDLEHLAESFRALQKKLEKSILDGSTSSKMGPLESFFQQELMFALELIRSIDNDISLISRQKSWDNMSADLLVTARSLFSHQTPESWRSGWNGSSMEPAAYLKHIDSLVQSCQNNMVSVKKSVAGFHLDVREMFHPDVLVAAMRHLAARESGVPLEQLVLCNEWSLDRLKNVPFVVSLTGIHIEGAVFDGDSLRECQYDSPTSSLSPTCYIAWVASDSSRKQTVGKKETSLPVFRDSARDLTAFSLSVPCEGDVSRWIRMGAAFILKI